MSKLAQLSESIHVYMYVSLPVCRCECVCARVCESTHLYMYMYNVHAHVVMRDEKEGRKKQARSNKQQGKATQHTPGSHFS